MLAWTTSPYNKSKNIDKKIVNGLLIACVGTEGLKVGGVAENIWKFIQGFFDLLILS